MIDLTPRFNFVGHYDPTLYYSVGDMCYFDDELQVFDGTAWQSLETSTNINEPTKIVYGTCKYCGAPLKSKTCEYCGVTNKGE